MQTKFLNDFDLEFGDLKGVTFCSFVQNGLFGNAFE
ncbi:MAG: hypothetical protein XD96_1239 [Petrotoga mobilis]|nr:MAG: hypothetical protein XD96_1239 [Petrotoga mobilis]